MLTLLELEGMGMLRGCYTDTTTESIFTHFRLVCVHVEKVVRHARALLFLNQLFPFLGRFLCFGKKEQKKKQGERKHMVSLIKKGFVSEGEADNMLLEA